MAEHPRLAAQAVASMKASFTSDFTADAPQAITVKAVEGPVQPTRSKII
jgi:hypothetical protein